METVDIRAENTALKSENKALKSRLQMIEAQLALLTQKTFHIKSEKHSPWPELPFEFNEAEVIVDSAQDQNHDSSTVKAYNRTKRKSRTQTQTPDHLPRVDAYHKADVNECPCCQAELQETTPEIQEQLACLPSKFYVVRNHYQKLTCTCQQQPPIVAPRPPRALPKSGIHALAVATWIEQKYDYSLPLYRLERMAHAAGVELTRNTIAESIITVSQNVLQPLVNLMNDAMLAFDIIWIDETTLQVLKEPGRSPDNKSYLWIRRGGPPGQESILLDYAMHRNRDTCKRLLPDFQFYLVTGAN